MGEVTYRTATPADAQRMAELGRRTFIETFGHLYTTENLAAFLVNHCEERWAEELGDPQFAVRVAEEDGAFAGYAKLGPPTLPFEPRGPSIELRQFYVLKPWQGRGVANELMDWAIAEAKLRGAEDMYLSVFVENERARRFYDRYGFEFVGLYAFMVGTHADEDHVMRLPLKAKE